jgi:hypothetical protein
MKRPALRELEGMVGNEADRRVLSVIVGFGPAWVEVVRSPQSHTKGGRRSNAARKRHTSRYWGV